MTHEVPWRTLGPVTTLINPAMMEPGLGGLFGSRFPKKLLEISGFICPCVTGEITPNTMSGLFLSFPLSQELQLCVCVSVFTGPNLRDCLFGGLLDHLVQFIRLISSYKVPLPVFLLHFLPGLSSGLITCSFFEGVLLAPGPGAHLRRAVRRCL